MTNRKKNTLTPQEQALIGKTQDTGKMRVLKISDPEDSLRLRKVSLPLNPNDLQTETYSILKERMLSTVRDPENPGVGIAAPQVGVMKRLIAVERYDREEPLFEFYVNPEILHHSIETTSNAEGCLSVPDHSEEVTRACTITISYLDEKTGENQQETVEGYTAIIFQHEIDHLNGVLYIDRTTEILDENETS